MNNTYEALVNHAQANLTTPGVALANSTVLTDISAGQNAAGQAFLLPANYLQAGQLLRVSANGVYSTAATAPALTIGLYLGGVAGTALASVQITPPASESNSLWDMLLLARVESSGTAGALRTIGRLLLGGGQTQMIPAQSSSGNQVSVNTSVAQILTVGAQWSAASAQNSIQQIMFCVERLNEGGG